MFNLLPDNLKESIKHEYKLRLITLSLFFVIFIQISSLIFIFPSWVISKYKEKEVEARSEAVTNFLSSNNLGSIAATINSINQKITLLSNSLEYPKAIPLIDSIIKSKTNSILLRDFTYGATNDKEATIVLKGVALTREALVAYVKELEKTGLFKKVDLPISNLAKDKNINFFITITV